MGIAMTIARVPGPGDTSRDYGRDLAVTTGLETRIMSHVKEFWSVFKDTFPVFARILLVIVFGGPIVILGDWLIGNALFPFSGMMLGAYVAYFIYLLIEKLFVHQISFYSLGHQIFGSVIGIFFGWIGYRLGGYPLLPFFGLILGSLVGYLICISRDKNYRNNIK